MKQREQEMFQPPSDTDLEFLISRLADGDTQALELIYETTRASVYGLALSIVRQHQDAEDVTHDTYVTIFRSAAGYRPMGKPLAWIYTITKNLALMKVRQSKKQTPLSEELEAALPAEEPNLPVEEKLVWEAYLRELNEDEQKIVVLRAISGWKHREIAKYMDMSLQHVIVKYNRSIKKLARIHERNLRQIEEKNKK